MGYTTYHYLTVRGKEFTQETLDKLNEWLTNRNIIGYAIVEGEFCYRPNTDDFVAEFPGNEFVKWYEHEEDMIACSKEFPDLTFLLHGEGEESGDMWDEYFQNGKSEICTAQIVYPRPTKISWPSFY